MFIAIVALFVLLLMVMTMIVVVVVGGSVSAVDRVAIVAVTPLKSLGLGLAGPTAAAVTTVNVIYAVASAITG